MNKFLVLICFLFLLGCSTNPVKEKNERIVYRDLTIENKKDFSFLDFLSVEKKPIVEKKKETIKPLVVLKETIKPASKPNHIVSFYNESRKPLKRMDHFIEKLDFNTHYFLIGHSHGYSPIGNATLAQNRSKTVARWLVRKGINKRNIHLMSSWSPWADQNAPSKGVEIYLISDIKNGYLPLGNINE